jgi:hypothetical protein
MTIAVASPMAGNATQAYTGLTNPTYTIAADQAPVNGKQYVVTTLGGTQTGVEVSAASNPFTLLFTRPAVLRGLPPLNVSGQLANVPKNVWAVTLNKGVDVLSGQPKQIFKIRTEFALPAGADLADPESVRAAICAYAAALWESGNDLADSMIQGSL